jgi:FKBP-type peptidyl-prolyl cis-trans isomerase FkpA
MKSVRILAIFVVNAALISAFADPHWDPNAPIKPAPIPAKPDVEKVSYAIGMNLGLQRKQAKSDADIDAFAKGLNDFFGNKPTEIPVTDTMKYLNVMRSKGTNATAQDKHLFAYAMGLRWGSQLKENAPNCDTAVVVRAMKDVDQGKPTEIKESEMVPLLDQGRQYSLYTRGAKNRAEGAAFMAKMAKDPDVKPLTGGVLYRVIKSGNGRAVSTIGEHELMFIKYKGSYLDGREFDHHNRFPKGLDGGWPAWTVAAKKMKVGDHWQVYSPPEFSFGREGDPGLKVGPDSTVIWDLEVREIIKDDDWRLGTGRLGHGIAGRDNDDDLLPQNRGPHPIEFNKN